MKKIKRFNSCSMMIFTVGFGLLFSFTVTFSRILKNIDLAFLIAQILVTAIVVFMNNLRNDSISKSNKNNKINKKAIKISILLALVYILTPILINLLLYLINPNLIISSQNTKLIMEKIIEKPYKIIGTILLAPIYEEIIFKAGFFTFIHEIFQKTHFIFETILPAFLTAFIFSIGHDGLKPVFFMYFIPAIIGCFVYKKTKSLIPCIIAHIINNLATLLILI